MFDSPMEVGLKISYLLHANILNLQTEEELAAFPTIVEQNGESARYVDGTNTEINEDIYIYIYIYIRHKNLATSLALQSYIKNYSEMPA